MKLCKVTDLKGGEVLAKTVMTSDFKILLSDGITLRSEYIDKIKELGITEVYIKEDALHEKEVLLLKSNLERVFHDKVRDVMEKHIYRQSKELMELSQTADSIISNILEEDEIVEKIYDIKERSSDIYEHSVNICSLAVLVALKLKIEKNVVHDIAVGCLLHDLGLRYLEVPYTDRNMENFSKTELIEYKKHPIYGYSVLEKEVWISNLSKKIILSHHERMDGSGFPLKLKELPYEVKIVSVCDAFDEIICGIGCNRQKVYQAVEYLKTFKGQKFDTHIVNTFLEFTAVYPVGSKVLLSNNYIGKVVSQNREFPDRPVIQVVRDEQGELVSNVFLIDLIKSNNIFIEKVLE
ncbi:MAG: HD domain-containing protein [Lachnospiraceae bacterium]|nr:HD domain-containing protein [Lachnospiraceae bacterium]